MVGKFVEMMRTYFPASEVDGKLGHELSLFGTQVIERVLTRLEEGRDVETQVSLRCFRCKHFIAEVEGDAEVRSRQFVDVVALHVLHPSHYGQVGKGECHHRYPVLFGIYLEYSFGSHHVGILLVQRDVSLKLSLQVIHQDAVR